MNSLSDRIESLSNSIGGYMNGDLTEKGLCDYIADTLSALETILTDEQNALGQSIQHGKSFYVDIVLPKSIGSAAGEEPYGVHIFPYVSELSRFSQELFRRFPIKQQEKWADNFINVWKNCSEWNIDIDGRMFSEYGLNANEIASIIIFDALNVVYTDDIPDLVYTSYANRYVSEGYYEANNLPGLSRLLSIPIMKACFVKNWFNVIQKSEITANRIGIRCYDPELKEYKKDVLNGMVKMIRHSSNAFIVDDIKRRQYVDSLMDWVMRYSHDYDARCRTMHDEIIVMAKRTASPKIRKTYMEIMSNLGVELHERYSGALLESVNTGIFDDPNMGDLYEFRFNPYGKAAKQLGVIRQRRATESLFPKGTPKLPSDKDIDLLYVMVDQMQSQSDRRWALNRAFSILKDIDDFEDYYKDDESVMRRYEPVIRKMKARIDHCRDEILRKRSFKTQYKVFIEVPEGYEG